MSETQEQRAARLQREAEDRDLKRDCQVAQARALGQCATSQNERIALSSAKERRQRLDRHAKNIGVVDGVSRKEMRAWLEGMDNAETLVGATGPEMLELAGTLLRGSVAAAFVAQIRNNGGVTWPEMRSQLKKAFLSEDEDEYVREQLEHISQQGFEDVREYSRRFTDCVRKAYSPTEQKVKLVMDRIVKTYTRGLNNRDVQFQVNLERPKDLTAAVELAERIGRARWLSQRQRSEEPMDISSLTSAAHTVPAAQAVRAVPQQNLVIAQNAEIMASLKELKKEIAALKRSAASAPAGPSPPQAATNSGKKCYRCKQFGHIQKDCPMPTQSDRIKQLECMVAALTTGGDECAEQPPQ